jgi:hypothetical protein
VGFVPSHFGGELVAVERGYFPISSTGYRSIAGRFKPADSQQVTGIAPEFLNALAAAEDRARKARLLRLARRPQAGADRLANFLNVSMDANSAVDAGFFAPPADRVALWCGACRFLSLIDSDVRFQPAPTAPAWAPEDCAASLATERELLRFVHQLASGNFPAEPMHGHLSGYAYFELPPRLGGEVAFALPAFAPTPSRGMPASIASQDDDENDTVSATPIPTSSDDDPQLSLF